MPFFLIFADFDTLNTGRAALASPWKTTLFPCFCTRAWYPPLNTSGPPGPYHWQNIPQAWHLITVIFWANPFTNYKIPNHSGQISFLVNQFSRCLFVHIKIHEIRWKQQIMQWKRFLDCTGNPTDYNGTFFLLSIIVTNRTHKWKIVVLSKKSPRFAAAEKSGKYKPGLTGEIASHYHHKHAQLTGSVTMVTVHEWVTASGYIDV